MNALAGFNSDALKTILRGLRNFSMALPLLQVLEKPLAIRLSLCYICLSHAVVEYRVLQIAQ